MGLSDVGAAALQAQSHMLYACLVGARQPVRLFAHIRLQVPWAGISACVMLAFTQSLYHLGGAFLGFVCQEDFAIKERPGDSSTRMTCPVHQYRTCKMTSVLEASALSKIYLGA